MKQHRFGGQWTEVKLDILAGYLSAYTQALKNQGFELIYVDAFAGTGEWVPANEEEDEEIEPRRGSARIALETVPPFSQFHFIDKKKSHVDALKALAEQSNHPEIQIHRDDANKVICNLCSGIDWHNKRGSGRPKRAVLFLDPYGISVEWNTLEVISKTKAIDVWYLFPINAVVRQSPHDLSRMDESKRSALTRIFGTDVWLRRIYEASAQIDLFGAEPAMIRNADAQRLERFVRERLETAFAKVLPPKRLPAKGLHKFSLFFAISNDSPPATGLATKLAAHFLK